jgi:hypothetical protein
MKFLLAAFFLLGGRIQAESLLQTFGSGTNQFQIEFVEVGNPANAADTTGSPNPAGSVAYTYNLGKYEISRDMVIKANTLGGLGLTLGSLAVYGGNGPDRPATGIGWVEAAKFVNWLNTSTGNQAAYKISGSTFQLWTSADLGYQANNPYRNSLAKFWLPSAHEWYKGAYGSPDGTWYNYPTMAAPAKVTGGTNAATSVYGHAVGTGPADVTNAGGLSAYGTMGQGGNVWEWTESAHDGVNNSSTENREVRGSWWKESLLSYQSASLRSSVDPATETLGDASSTLNIGFRVAGIPEPGSGALLALGVGGIMAIKGRRRALSRSESR